jgi:hypothetical protein
MASAAESLGFKSSWLKDWQAVCRFSMVQGVLAVWETDRLLHPVAIAETQMHIMLRAMAESARTNPRRSAAG